MIQNTYVDSCLIYYTKLNMNNNMHTSLWNSIFKFLGQIHKSCIGESGSSSIWSLLKTLHTILYRSWSKQHSYQQWIRDSFTVNTCQHRLFILLLIYIILKDVRKHFIIVLICICLMISDVEYFFICLLASCLHSSEKWLILLFLPVVFND